METQNKLVKDCSINELCNELIQRKLYHFLEVTRQLSESEYNSFAHFKDTREHILEELEDYILNMYEN